MELNLFFTSAEYRRTSGTSVVIDVLRVSSTIIYLLEKGCSSILPVNTVKEAFLNKTDNNTLLCGERNARKIKGFDLGNSPSEILSSTVKNKKVVITSSNGIKTLLRCYSRPVTIIASFLNIKAVSEFLRKKSENINIICAGAGHLPSVEDTLCGGQLINALKEGAHYKLNDSALIAESFYMFHEMKTKEIINKSEHALRLKELGFAADIDLCLNKNSSKIVPVFQNGLIKTI